MAKPKNVKSTEELCNEVSCTLKSNIKSESFLFEQVISTGSTLLDLAICGKRIRGGGLPGGIIAEFYGPAGQGKTSILTEACAYAQAKGGETKFKDPEARLDQEYARIYGVKLNKENYSRPNTVEDVFEDIIEWEPKSNNVINIIATDSLAALSTRMEMEDEDKMGMRRGKEFSQGFRRVCRKLKNDNILMLCSNQIREGTAGETTPGGNAIPFYSSLRVRIGKPAQGGKIKKEAKVGEKNKIVEKVIGIKSVCSVKKNTIDEPFRECDIYIVFGYGIDDVRGNLQYIKDITGGTSYDAITKDFKSMDDAITHIEVNNLQDQLKEKVIELWEEIDNKFKFERVKKMRG